MFPSKELVSQINKNVLNLMKINHKVSDWVDDDVNKVKKMKCIGIHIRGTDMVTNTNHPDPFSPSRVIDFLVENNINNLYDSIMLCTDEVEIIQKMKEEFGKEKIIVFNSWRASKGRNEGVHNSSEYPRVNHHYKLGLEVLRDMLCLATCDAFICGPSNVAYAAIVHNNNKYSHLYVWDKERFVQHY